VENTIQILHKQLLEYHSEYKSLSKRFEDLEQPVRKKYIKEVTAYNGYTSQGRSYDTTELAIADELMDTLRTQRITQMHSLLNKLNPLAEVFMSKYELLEAGVKNKSIDLDLILTYLKLYLGLLNDGSRLLIYSSQKSDQVRGALKKYLNWPLVN